MTHSDLALFPVVVEQDVAWGDMDSYAHVNNVVYFRYFENARITLLDRIGWIRSMQESGLGPIAASTSARFRKPLTYPDTIWVTARVTDIEGDRFHLEHRVVSRRLGAVAAEGKGTVVTYDHRHGRKVSMPEELRRRIEALEATAAQS